MSIMVASGRGASAGVLFRDAEAIEALRDVDTLVVDKTGTLTAGKPVLVAVETLSGFDEAALLRLAAAVERGSEHPLAAAVLAGAVSRDIAVAPATAFSARHGKGVVADVDGHRVAVGNPTLLRELDIDADALAARAEELRAEGSTALLVAVDGLPAGLLAVADPIADGVPEALRE